MGLLEVVRRFGVEADEIRRLQARENVHWAVRSGDRRFVLRRYGAHNADPGSIAWEQVVLRHLADRGWPVAPSIGEVIEVAGLRYALFPFIAGRDRRNEPGMYRRCGRLLAQLHGDLEQLEVGQRPNWKDSFEVARTSARRHLFDERLAPIDPDLARRAHEMSEAAEAALRELEHLPRMVVHSDLAPWNVRFAGDRVAAIFDFELSRVDARACDLAWARRGYHDEAVEGYLEVRAVSAAELASLHHFWIAWALNGLLDNLERPHAHTSMKWYLEQIEKTRPYGA